MSLEFTQASSKQTGEQVNLSATVIAFLNLQNKIEEKHTQHTAQLNLYLG